MQGTILFNLKAKKEIVA